MTSGWAPEALSLANERCGGGGSCTPQYGSRVAELEVADRIATAGAQLTVAERRVAQAVLEHPNLVAFGTVADLAAQAGAGAATVVRLASKLGFDGFTALQSSVQDDLARQLRPAVERIRELADRPRVERHRANAVANVTETMDKLNRDAFDAVIAVLGDPQQEVLVLAGEAEHGVAQQFVHDLGALRDGVSTVAGNDVAVRRQLALSPPRSTLVVIDLRRYERWLLDAVTFASDAGHTIIALTDGPLSPLANQARVRVHVGGPVRLAIRQPHRDADVARADRGRGRRTVADISNVSTGAGRSGMGGRPLAHRRVSSARTPSRRTGRFRSSRSSNPIAARATTSGSWVGAANLVTRVGV